MNLIQQYKIPEDEILKSINFLKKCDFVYAATVPLKNVKECLDVKSYFTIDKNDHTQTMIAKKFELNDGDIIFCNTSYVFQLFKTLKKLPNLKGLILITAQSDLKISNRIYRKKPNSIEKWFCVNSSITKKDLIPIPFGIANISYNKNLVYEDFLNFESNQTEKINKIYGNFNLNTNYFHRLKAKNFLNDKRCEFIDVFDQKSYITSLHSYKFILCPWGNGIDTHRYWECIYAGAIPITLINHNYKMFSNLPSVLIKNYNKKNIDFIFESINSNFELKHEMLMVSWWFDNLIKPNQSKSSRHLEQIVYSKNQQEIIKKKILINITVKNLIKKLKTLIRKVHNSVLTKN